MTAASPAQRRKVAGKTCIACGAGPCDPAHVVSRAQQGCDDPLCVVPLCRRHHRAFDTGELDLLPALERSARLELQHALGHVPLLQLLRRTTNARWQEAA